MSVEILAVQGIGEVAAGDDLAELIMACAPDIRDGDVLVVTSKIVSKAEGRVFDIERDAAIDSETVRLVARRGDTRIVQTRHGFVMAAAGVDASNVAKGSVALLPVDSDASASRLRASLRERLGVNVGVVISDTFGRPWRVGVTDAAVGVAGFAPLDDLRGSVDAYGNELQATVTCVADEIASAADLVKGKMGALPVAIVRGLAVVDDPDSPATQGIQAVIRPADEDLFSLGTRDVVPARVDVREFSEEPVSAPAVRRALAMAAAAAKPIGWDELRLLAVESLDVKTSLALVVPELATVRAPVIVVPYLVSVPGSADLLAAGAAIENVLVGLAVEQLGSGWLWLSAGQNTDVARVLGLDEAAHPVGIIAIGHSA
jgi:coenzyme F420-0:L-glutamate ligase/coenzyme F420-1:gamma-L-glutamate ligase